MMESMDGWDIALLVVAGYFAVLTLVRLMNQRRNQTLNAFRRELAAEKRRQQAEEAQGRQRRGQAA